MADEADIPDGTPAAQAVAADAAPVAPEPAEPELADREPAAPESDPEPPAAAEPPAAESVLTAPRPSAKAAAAKPEPAVEAPSLPEPPPAPAGVVGPDGQPIEFKWFVLKVQSNREDSIREAILRNLKIHGLEAYVEQVMVPTENVKEIKDGKPRTVRRKLYPGYVMLRMAWHDETWFTIKSTQGVGHFVGSGDKPTPMSVAEVDKMLGNAAKVEKEPPKLKVGYAKGDRVVLHEGAFENYEGEVEEVNEDKGMVRVMIMIFGRPTPVDIEYYKVSLVKA